MKEVGMGPLPDGARAVIIGGGPGGVAVAIALKQGAQDLGRDLNVTILEGKQFVGEQHHNQCAGVLAPPVVELIEHQLQIPFPHKLCRNIITGYVLHTARSQLTLDGDDQPSLSLRRVQFDAYLLQAACDHGVMLLPARATGLEFHDDRALVYTESEPLEADVVVGAFGLDEGTAAIFARAVQYQPPPALSSIVTKYHPGDEGTRMFGQRIHAFLPPSSRIEFAGISPKGNHLTINIAGSRVDARIMDLFLDSPAVRQVLPCFENAGRLDANDLRYFKGRFPFGLARNFSGDRYVMVGDAAGLVRAFKGKGVTAAIQTGLRAAEVILRQGVSGAAFKDYHAANRDILDDLPYGRAMRLLTILASRSGMMDSVLRAAEKNQELRQALFDAVSAQRPYRGIIRKSFSPPVLCAIARALFEGA